MGEVKMHAHAHSSRDHAHVYTSGMQPPGNNKRTDARRTGMSPSTCVLADKTRTGTSPPHEARINP
jgi:hypothetical protein